MPVEEAVRKALPRLSAETLPEFRQPGFGGVPGTKAPDLTAGGKVRVEERLIPGPQNAPDVTLLILSPVDDRGPKAGIYHIHGGGMVTGYRHAGVHTLLPYVAEGNAVVVSVEYRLAPENPDPAPVEDCYTGLAWVARNAEELGINPQRLIVTGASAGGGLAAGTAPLARDRGFPEFTHQVLVCPMFDDCFQSHSARMLDGEGICDRNDNVFHWTALLGDRRGTDDVSIYAAPARAEDLTGLPRTYVDVGSTETFRDEAIAYAQRLSEAGISVDLHMWGGGFHGFDMVAAHTAISRASNATRDEFFRRALEE
ncbi:alpha/beta hydrolase [Streptomyces sp. KL116D]|uniref:alpha/beta hydrolase n=1 Tax=Streptomyces sp. KL116D TaxID=3045152 RepID=UPI0035589111